jgi:hypothetical protein
MQPPHHQRRSLNFRRTVQKKTPSPNHSRMRTQALLARPVSTLVSPAVRPLFASVKHRYVSLWTDCLLFSTVDSFAVPPSCNRSFALTSVPFSSSLPKTRHPSFKRSISYLSKPWQGAALCFCLDSSLLLLFYFLGYFSNFRTGHSNIQNTTRNELHTPVTSTNLLGGCHQVLSQASSFHSSKPTRKILLKIGIFAQLTMTKTSKQKKNKMTFMSSWVCSVMQLRIKSRAHITRFVFELFSRRNSDQYPHSSR